MIPYHVISMTNHLCNSVGRIQEAQHCLLVKDFIKDKCVINRKLKETNKLDLMN